LFGKVVSTVYVCHDKGANRPINQGVFYLGGSTALRACPKGNLATGNALGGGSPHLKATTTFASRINLEIHPTLRAYLKVGAMSEARTPNMRCTPTNQAGEW